MPKYKSSDIEEKGKAWREGELIQTFGLTSITLTETQLLSEWLDVTPPILNEGEQFLFDKALTSAKTQLRGWGEEDLKMKFISLILALAQMDDDNIIAYFDKTISATVEGIKLTVKSDFMLAKGVLETFSSPYFHFQEYKPYKNPSGDSMAQLLEAFLIAQVKNNNEKPLYGLEIVGANWKFVVMEAKTYCISKTFDATDREDLLKIIAILRKFRKILYEKLVD